MRLVVAVVLVVGACKGEHEAPEPRKVAVAPAGSAVAEPPPIVAQCKPGERTCVDDDVVQCRADATIGATIESCKGACRAGACVDTCAVRDVELIYVVDANGELASFDPKKLPGDPFQVVAKLECDPASTLNSMAVDRYGVAWLGYHDGKVYRASISDGHCSPLGVTPEGAPLHFGMGYVSDGPKLDTEKLFVAGGEDAQGETLATIDTHASPVTWKVVAPITEAGSHPELTGTGDGKLFAYFPSPGHGFVQQLDRATGKPVGTRWVLPTKEGDHVSAYAFAHWGGVFYVFTTDADGDAMVHAVHMKTGTIELVMAHRPGKIVGAGVSTCAPLLEKAL